MNEDYGNRIKRIRQNRRLKLKDVAEQSGLSIPYLSNIERGHRKPTLRALTKISRALDIAFVVDGANDEETVNQ